MTPDLHHKAEEVDKSYRQCLSDHRAHAEEYEVSEHAYRQAHATAMLAASGTASDKKAQADKATNAEMLRRNRARGALRTTESALRYWENEKREVIARIYAERAEMSLAS